MAVPRIELSSFNSLFSFLPVMAVPRIELGTSACHKSWISEHLRKLCFLGPQKLMFLGNQGNLDFMRAALLPLSYTARITK